MTRDEIVEKINDAVGEEEAEEVILFDGMEDAFLGVAERFEPIMVTRFSDDGEETIERGGTHRVFAVYSYEKMVQILTKDDQMDREDACEYLEFNTVGLYAGPNTPAIMRDAE